MALHCHWRDTLGDLLQVVASRTARKRPVDSLREAVGSSSLVVTACMVEVGSPLGLCSSTVDVAERTMTRHVKATKFIFKIFDDFVAMVIVCEGYEIDKERENERDMTDFQMRKISKEYWCYL